MTVDPGKYRYYITIVNPASDSSRDAAGGRVGLGATVCMVWAEKTDWGGTETDEEKRLTATVETKWHIRYRTDILPKMFILLGSDIYNIHSVMDFDGLKRELTLTTRKVVAP